ncbi:M20 family metallopeptidase [uncultured Fusobacterium sp.]|uniref:M20 family metallopeptidase n=1 Tax=uncultured Fusobacterium sp. TaxID=159267 RepID=UPI0025FED65F|nr:M20 family metallopeptidase [uncultured Fusobacterium sp.]
MYSKNELYEIENILKKDIEEVSDYIFKNPELGNEEYKASEYLVNKLKENGFNVEENYCGMKTAFRAEKGSGSPKIAFLAEYDALPGYGKEKKPGHACGHNWIAASTYGSALTLSKIIDKLGGTVILIGTPAEETVGGKVPMVEQGAFDDIDIVLQSHLESQNNIACKTLAIDCIKFQFRGRASHAAAHPEDGINALDAINLMYAGIGCLRQHIKSDARIHGIITQGGDAPNTVPDFTEAKFHIRSESRKYLDELTKKVINIAKGASLMTGTEVFYEKFENSFDNLVNLKSLQKLMKKNLEEVGIENINEEGKGASGSSDIGNVSQVCPTMYIEIALDIEEVCHVHDEAYLKYVNSLEAYDKLHKAVKAMCGVALEIYNNEKLLQEIKKEFNER